MLICIFNSLFLLANDQEMLNFAKKFREEEKLFYKDSLGNDAEAAMESIDEKCRIGSNIYFRGVKKMIMVLE